MKCRGDSGAVVGHYLGEYWRERAGLSRHALAKAAGVRQHTVAAAEAGKVPHLRTVERVAGALGLDPSKVWQWPSMQPVDPAALAAMDAEAMEILAASPRRRSKGRVAASGWGRVGYASFIRSLCARRYPRPSWSDFDATIWDSAMAEADAAAAFGVVAGDSAKWGPELDRNIKAAFCAAVYAVGFWKGRNR